MAGRLAGAVVASAILVGSLASATPAAAQSSDVMMLTPADGDTVRDRVTLVARVDREGAGDLAVRLTQDESTMASGTTSFPLPCYQDCESPSSLWGNRTWDPIGGAPFSSTGVCNGRWMLQTQLDKGPWTTAAAILLSAPPSPPTGLRIADAEGGVEVTWNASRSPDVQGYRVERSTNGAGFGSVGELAGDETRFVDATAPAGDNSYRVVAIRPDGLVNGTPAPPCSDKGLDLENSSDVIFVNKQASTPDPQGDGQGTSGDGSGGQTGTGGSGSGQAGSGSTSPSGGSSAPEQGGTTSSGSGSTTSSSGGARSVAPPPSASRHTDTSVTAPELGSQERYYGEDEEGFSEEIDYGDMPVIAGKQVVGYEEDGTPIFRTVPGGTETVLFDVLDASKLRMIAVGLLFVALAMHARRWLNATH